MGQPTQEVGCWRVGQLREVPTMLGRLAPYKPHSLSAFENEHTKSPKKLNTTYALNTMSKFSRLP